MVGDDKFVDGNHHKYVHIEAKHHKYIHIEATVMLEATGEVEGTRKSVKSSRIEGGIFLVTGLSLAGRLSVNST